MVKSTKDSKRNNQRGLQIFLVYFALFFLAYAVMMRMRFSVDSYSNFYVTDGGIQNLKLGRVANFVLLSVLNNFNINIVKHQVIFTGFFILILAWSAKVLYEQISSYMNCQRVEEKLFLFMSISVVYINVSILEWFLFPEMAIFWSCTVAMVTASIYWFFQGNHGVRYLISFVLLCIALNFYQAAIGFYVVIGTAIILIKNNMQATKNTIVECFKYYVIAGGACIITVETLTLLVHMGIVPLTERSPSFDIAAIASNTLKVIQAQKSIWWDGMSFIPGLVGLTLLVLLAILVVELRKTTSWTSVLLISTLLLIAYVSIFAPHFLTHTFWMAPRTIYSFFSFITLLCILILFGAQNFHHVSMVGNGLLIVFTAANIMVIQQVASDQVAVNRLDQGQAQQIIQCIEKYELESGNEVQYISVQPDGYISYSYPGINSTYMDMNLRAMSTSWAAVKCLNYYSGKDYIQVERDRDTHCSHFRKDNWDQFEPNEQLYFEDDVMYWMIY